MILLAVLVALEAVALLGAAVPARVERGYRPIAWLVGYALANELAMEALRRYVRAAPHPLEGLPLAALHASNAIWLGWPACLVAAAWTVFAPSRAARAARDLVVGIWLGTVLAAAGAAPFTKATLTPLLHVYDGAAVLGALAAVPRGWRRPWGTQHHVVLVLVAIELTVATIGPFVRSPYTDWHLATIAYLIGFAAVALLQVGALRRRPRRDSGAEVAHGNRGDDLGGAPRALRGGVDGDGSTARGA